MRVDLEGKVALVTGGANGIGRAIVQALADNGAQVVIVDIEAKTAQNAAEKVAAGGGSCTALAGDVADRAAMEGVVAEVMKRFGHLDILINDAGINTKRDRVPIHQYAVEDWEAILRVDLTGVFITSRAAIPALLQSGGGTHREHQLHRRAGAAAPAERLCGRQGGRGQPHPFHGPGAGRARYPGERRGPWLHPHPRHRGALLRQRWRLHRQRDQPPLTHPAGPPRTHGRDRCGRSLSGLARGQLYHGRHPSCRRRVARRLYAGLVVERPRMLPKEIVQRAIERRDPPRLPINYCNRDWEFSDTFPLGMRPAAGFEPSEAGMTEWGYVWHKLDETMGQPKVHPLSDWGRMQDYVPPDPYAPGRLEHLPEAIATHHERFLKFGLGITGFNIVTFLRGFEDFLMDLYLERARVEQLLDLVWDFENGIIEQMAVYPADAVAFGDDWGTQKGLMIAPTLWREVFKPRYVDQFARVHRQGKKVWFHTCGDVHCHHRRPDRGGGGRARAVAARYFRRGAARLRVRRTGVLLLRRGPPAASHLGYARGDPRLCPAAGGAAGRLSRRVHRLYRGLRLAGHERAELPVDSGGLSQPQRHTDVIHSLITDQRQSTSAW